MTKKIFHVANLWVLAVMLGLFLGDTSNAQCSIAGVTEQFEPLNSRYENFKVYPSMAPRVYVKISYQSFTDPQHFVADSLEKFFIVKDGDDCAKRLKIDRFEKYNGGNYLVFDAKSNGLKITDELNIGILVEVKDKNGNVVQKLLMWDSNDDTKRRKIPIPEIDSYTLKVTPDYILEQELVDGTKKPVGQLKFTVDVPSLVTNSKIARVYFNTDNVISTNWKDKNSKLETKIGLERSLTDKWYMPIHFETKVNGDQRVKNATFVASSGIKTILPWESTKRALFNQIIRAPVSPEFGLSTEYYRRLKQDTASLAKFPRKDSFALAGEFKWLPIQLFTPSCNIKGAGGNFEKDPTNKLNGLKEDFDKCFSSQNISLELAAKGWWFPYEKDLVGTKVRRYEGRAEISLLIPITSSIVDQFLFKKKDDVKPINATQRFRIKYVIGANDARGFERSSQLSFGIELIK